MHIGYITTEYISVDGRFSGGLANYISKVGKSLSRQGHRVTVFCLSSRNYHWKDERIDIYEVKQSQLQLPNNTSLNDWLRIVNQLLSAKGLEKKVWDIHSNIPLDILQTASYKTPGYTLINNRYIPLVCRISSYTPILRAAFGSKKTLVDSILDWLESQQIINADISFAPSEFIASMFLLMESYGPQVLRSPIDTQILKEDFSLYERILKNKKYLLFFSWLNAVKGVDLVAEAMPQILKQYPDIYFVFIGGNHYLPQQKQRAMDYIYSCNALYKDRIIYHEPIPKDLLYGILNNALAVLLPSRVDNLPNACLEAFQYGIPVIGSTRSSIEEMIEDGKTGFLFENGDANCLYDKIEMLLTMTEPELQKMHENILLTIQHINAEDRVGKLLNLYEEAKKTYASKYG